MSRGLAQKHLMIRLSLLASRGTGHCAPDNLGTLSRAPLSALLSTPNIIVLGRRRE